MIRARRGLECDIDPWPGNVPWLSDDKNPPTGVDPWPGEDPFRDPGPKRRGSGDTQSKNGEPAIDLSPLARIAGSADRGLRIADSRTERAQAAGGAVGLTWLLALL